MFGNKFASTNAFTHEFEDDNPYLAEVGTYLDLRVRVKQMQDSGQQMYMMKKAFAESQIIDSRMIDNDSDLTDESFEEMDEIDRFNTSTLTSSDFVSSAFLNLALFNLSERL